MIYGYARVSTKGQSRDGNGLEVQTKLLREAGAQEIYADSFTGTKRHRPELDKLMEKIQPGDTLVVTKLDRIARSVTHGLEIVRELLAKGVRVDIKNVGVIDDTPMGNFFITVMLAVAELERNQIVERTQEGKAIARQKPGFREGRPPVKADKFPIYLEQVREGKLTKTEAALQLGVSRKTWYNLEKRYAN